MHLPPPELLFIFKKYLEWANLNIRFLYSYLLPQPKLIIYIYIYKNLQFSCLILLIGTKYTFRVVNILCMNHTFYINYNIFNIFTFYITELYIYDSFYALCALIHNNP